MRTLTIAKFHAELRTQGVSNTADFAFVCPMCKTVQSMRDFVAAGDTIEQAERFVGFSCIGRRRANTKRAGEAKPGEGCDWTLGGLFKIHELEVVDAEGKRHPRFELASAAEAQAHAARASAGAAA